MGFAVRNLVYKERTPGFQLTDVGVAAIIEATEGSWSSTAVTVGKVRVTVGEPAWSKEIKLGPEAPRAAIVKRGSCQADAEAKTRNPRHFHHSHGACVAIDL